MRREVQWMELGQGQGPRVLLLPGLGARGSGFLALAQQLVPTARPILVEYPEGEAAACGAGVLARQVAAGRGRGGRRWWPASFGGEVRAPGRR
ncbi:alpha/beta hydrolase, partial [Myxococcus sp. 1LA]